MFFFQEPGQKKQDCCLPPQQKETNKAHLTEDLIAVVTEVNAAIDVVEWIIDSGATRHICSQKSLFKTLNESPRDNIFLDDASALQVAGIGEVNLKLSSGRVLTLTKVLFVPNMRRNLISSALLMIAGFKQTLEAGKLVITKNGGYVGNAFCKGNLFVLQIMNESAGASAYFVSAMDTWHGRLGHLNVNSIRRLKHAKLISDNLEKMSQNVKFVWKQSMLENLFHILLIENLNCLSLFTQIWLILKAPLVEVASIIISLLLMIVLDIRGFIC